MNKPKFCYENCKNLDPTEEEQRKTGMRNNPFHYCNKYKIRVMHGGYHPNLIKLGKCNYNPEDSLFIKLLKNLNII